MENFPILTPSLSLGTIGWIRGQEIEIDYSRSPQRISKETKKEERAPRF
jgi:hypothetical protein